MYPLITKADIDAFTGLDLAFKANEAHSLLRTQPDNDQAAETFERLLVMTSMLIGRSGDEERSPLIRNATSLVAKQIGSYLTETFAAHTAIVGDN